MGCDGGRGVCFYCVDEVLEEGLVDVGTEGGPLCVWVLIGVEF